MAVCWFIGALFRGLWDLPLGLRRFVPCDIGANHCGLRRKVRSWSYFQAPGVSDQGFFFFFTKLLVLFGNPNGSVAALLAGVLPLRYCSAKLACEFPTWELPDRRHIGELVTKGDIDGHGLGGERVCRVPLPGSAGGAGVLCEGRVLGGFKRIRLNKKHRHTLQDLVVRGVFRLVLKFGRD